MSIHLILKSIQGDFLAQISDVAGQVSIGSDAICDLQIPDDEVKSEQLRFSYLNGDLWLQVPDPSETVKIEDQNLREAKLTTSTVVFFKDYYIEVLFKTEETVGRGQTISTSITNSILTVDEATRVVDTSSEKTRIASSKDASAALQFNEATRVLNSNEATRVISTQEATRIVTTGAQPTPREKMKVSLSKTQGGSLSPSFQTTDFPIIFKKMAAELKNPSEQLKPLQ